MAAPRPGSRETERVIHAEIARLVEERFGRHVVPSSSDRLHDDLGLTSLELAELGLRLEHLFNVNPFEQSSAATQVRTVGHVCEACGAQPAGAGPASTDESLLASRSRAEARRRHRIAR